MNATGYGKLLARAASGIRSGAIVAAPPVARIALALPFMRSGLTRWDGFLSLAPATEYLFAEQFRLHLLGGQYALPWPGLVAWLVAVAEIALPALLLAGLATRFAAACLLLMTGVIQLVFPDGWANFHLYWAALALCIMASGPGLLSVDHLMLARRTSRLLQPRSCTHLGCSNHALPLTATVTSLVPASTAGAGMGAAINFMSLRATDMGKGRPPSFVWTFTSPTRHAP